MEKQSLPRRLVLGGVIVLGLAAAVALVIGRATSPKGPPDGVGAKDATSAPAQGARAAARGPLLDDQAPAIPTQPAMPDEIIEEILKTDQKLGLFMHYHRNVLLDAQGRDEYRKLLADLETMTAMAEALMKPGNGPVEPKEHYHRLMQIDYLEAALDWKDNPQREKALELTGNIISKDNFTSDQSNDRRQMLAGGKVELYRLLYGQDVEKAAALVASAQGTRTEALVNWMAKDNLRRLAKEEQIRAEMQALQAE